MPEITSKSALLTTHPPEPELWGIVLSSVYFVFTVFAADHVEYVVFLPDFL